MLRWVLHVYGVCLVHAVNLPRCLVFICHNKERRTANDEFWRYDNTYYIHISTFLCDALSVYCILNIQYENKKSITDEGFLLKIFNKNTQPACLIEVSMVGEYMSCMKQSLKLPVRTHGSIGKKPLTDVHHEEASL